MDSNYSFLNNVLNGKSKTVWSYKKQKELLKIVLDKYPKPIDLKNKLLRIGTDNSKLLANYIDENWDEEAYIDFILKYIVKYSRIGKILISQLIGTAVGTLAGYGINKYFYPTLPSKKEYMDKINSLPNDAQRNAYTDSVMKDYIKNEVNKSSTIKNLSPFALGIGTKGLSAYGTYKLLDIIDKKQAKKNA